MSKASDLARLGQISQLILDVKLAALHVAAGKRQQSLDLLANLNLPSAPSDLSPVAAHHAELRYQHWADARRGEINLLLARQTAEMNVARDDAGQAFGKDQALRRLRVRLR
jgi:hypothetical protein